MLRKLVLPYVACVHSEFDPTTFKVNVISHAHAYHLIFQLVRNTYSENTDKAASKTKLKNYTTPSASF
jgi:hypothetical protein